MVFFDIVLYMRATLNGHSPIVYVPRVIESLGEVLALYLLHLLLSDIHTDINNQTTFRLQPVSFNGRYGFQNSRIIFDFVGQFLVCPYNIGLAARPKIFD